MTEKQMTPSTKTHRKHARKNPVPSSPAHPRVVLVGTYKPGQLEDWPGWYCWPLDREDTGRKGRKDRKSSDDAQSGSHADANQYAALKQVSELWLFLGTAEQRTYSAEFVGVKTREELVRDYGYPAKGKPHGTRYALFKTEFIYNPKNNGLADKLIVRTSDFANSSPEIAKQLKDYLESPDRRNPALAKYLPEIVTTTSSERLCVCEEAEQLEFWDIPSMRCFIPEVPFPPPTSPRFTFIDLFAGVGGIRMGFQNAGGECVFSSEWNEEAAKTYFLNFGEHPRGDITKIKEDEIPDFDVLLAGFPCQPFSISGKMKGFADTRGTLFFDVCRIIEAKRPRVIFLENVKHLVHHDNGRTLETILCKLEDFGYSVSWKVLNASDFGVPQNRERIIIVGSDRPFDFSLINTKPKGILADFLDSSGNFEVLSPDEYTLIENPKRQEDSGLIFAGYRNKSIRKVGVRPGTLHLSRVHKQPNRIYSVEGIHPTLPSQESSGRYFILTRENIVRKLTIDECWRIMGFPEEFERPSAIGEQYRQLGNSVCVPMITAVAKEVVRQLIEGKSNEVAC